ncbi:hypothetical protein DV738_g3684, partial [Chaetothyriales sp. CBS 135597]
MAFRISRLAKTDEDAAVIAHLAEIQLKAWLTVPLYALLYPGPPSTHPTVLNLTRTRHTESLLNDPWCHFLVASHHTAKLGAHVNVEILATLPEYHGRGAGRALLTQVLAEADAQGLTTVLEASQEGARLYHSVGFVPEEDGKFDLWVDLGRWEGGGDKGADWRGEASKERGEGWYKQAVLIREPKSIS